MSRMFFASRRVAASTGFAAAIGGSLMMSRSDGDRVLCAGLWPSSSPPAAAAAPTPAAANNNGLQRQFSSEDRGVVDTVHFRGSSHQNPLADNDRWINPTQNYVWSDEELEEVLSTQPKYVPEDFWDNATYKLVRFSYWFFNLVSGYSYDNPTTGALELRVIMLESIAGIPGMVGAQHRHFRSLRTLERDYGWIHTLLEEAENERMHLLVFMQMFEPEWYIRWLVQFAQVGIAVPYILLYITNPKAAHRFVGYLEETAVHTYCDVIQKMQTPGTHLSAWNDLEPPQIAKDYWMLKDDCTFLDVIKVIAADETHHRDVNHTFACMKDDDPNPFVSQHLQSAERAWRMRDAKKKDGTPRVVGENDAKELWS